MPKREAVIQVIVQVRSDTLWHELRDRIPTINPTVAGGTPDMAEEFRRLYRKTDFTSGECRYGGHDGGLISSGHDMAVAAHRFLEIATTA